MNYTDKWLAGVKGQQTVEIHTRNLETDKELFHYRWLSTGNQSFKNKGTHFVPQPFESIAPAPNEELADVTRRPKFSFEIVWDRLLSLLAP